MKNTKKLLVVLLTLAVLFTCSAVFASAAAADEYQTAYEDRLAVHQKVLEYYEAGYYLNADFNGVSDLESAFADSTEEFSMSKGSAFGYEFDEANGTAHFTSVNSTYFDFVPNEASSFGVKARIKLGAGATFSLFLHSSERGSVGDSLRVLSISEGELSYKLNYTAVIPQYEIVENEAIVADTYLDIDFVLNNGAGTDTITITITPEGAEGVTYTHQYDNTTTDFLNGKMDFNSFYITVDDVTFDTLQVYNGSFSREIDNANNVEVIANKILNIRSDYEQYRNRVTGNAYELLEIVSALVVTYGYDCTSLENEQLVANVNAFATVAVNAVAPQYATAYADGVENINSEAAYYDRIEHLNTISIYSDFLNRLTLSAFGNVPGVNYDKIAEDVNKVKAEEDSLAKVKADTLKALEVAILIPDVYAANYKQYEEAYEILSAYPICTTYYDDTYSAEVVFAASKVANVIIFEYPVLNSRAKAFVEAVPVAADSTLGFAERYVAFTVAKENMFTDESYNEYLEGTTIADLIAAYNEADAALSGPASYAEKFLSKISDAVNTSSYSVKTVLLDEAETYLDTVEKAYPGVAEAIETYTLLRKEISEKIEATKKYIQAVIEVMDAKTIEERKTAIAKAKELAVEGSDVSVEVTGYDMTVTLANIKLAEKESEIVLAETKVKNYVDGASSLANITDYSELRRKIAEVTALKEKADPTAAGVAEADAALEAAIAAFNEAMNAANSAAKEVNNVALSTLGATVPTQRIGEVIAILKKFYE